jgi:hypothetical protein
MTAPDGTFRYNNHIRKGHQKYKPWWEQSEEEQKRGRLQVLLVDTIDDCKRKIATATNNSTIECFQNILDRALTDMLKVM